MRPVRLTFQAFGSYGGEVRIDFARLSRHGIFAISGPTGAGKSTIFDALVYALYDDLPGFRVDGNIRSQYAGDSVETRVRLELEVRGERWAVERKPTQHLRRRRGLGNPIERKSTVLLERVAADGTRVDGSGLSRKSAVRERIETLVGLSKAQFEQVVLIPQGRFEEVLKADTKARAVLLRRLFPVDVYGRVTDALKAMTDSRNRAFVDASRSFDELVERLRASLVSALHAAGTPVDDELLEPGALDVDDLARHLAALGTARLGLQRAVAIAHSEHDHLLRRLVDARKSASEFDRWQSDLARAAAFSAEETADTAEGGWLERARRVAHLDGALKAWELAAATLATGEPQCTALREQVRADAASLSHASDAVDLMDGHAAARAAERFRRDAAAALDEITRFDALVEEGRSLAVRATEIEERRAAMGRCSAALEAERRVLEEMADEVDALAQSAVGLPAAEAAVRLLEAERAACVRRSEAVSELEAAGLEREAAAAAAASARGRVEGVRTAWRDGLAGRLAELLVEGEACPTCGAHDHPNPALRPHDAPDDDALAAAESACDVAQRVLRRAEERHAAARGALDALSDTRPFAEVDAALADQRSALLRCQDAAGRRAPLGDRLKQRRTSLETARAAVDRDGRALEVDGAALASADVAYAKARATYEQQHGGLESPAGEANGLAALADDVERLAQLLAGLEAAGASERQCRDLLDPLLGELGVDDPSGLSLWRCDPDELAERARALAERADARGEVRRRIAGYELAGGPSVRPDLVSMEAAETSAQERHLELVRRHAVMEESAGFFTAGPSMLETAAKEVAAARRALEQTRTMADRCAGAGGGASPTRLSLENWVLADYLRHVLVQANARLAAMTAGRFALQLSDGVTDGRKAWGLELSAFDAYTGQVRPATTLSGGETFMAALALALGLADVVSGGSNREMGALFVDEGFGSLDPQSLESVVDVLRSLEDGGRLVGVVSHVEAVQHALPVGIAVRTSPCGSAAEVRYPFE